MAADLRPDFVAQALAAQGAAPAAARAQAHAAAIATMLDGTAAAYAAIPMEQEPAAYVAELRRNAP
jgi:hypothetical protein